MEYHEAAEAFPLMDQARYEDLKADITANGLIEPITLYEGKILDGRNRYRACLELGITPKFRQFAGDPWAYVWSLNGQRRDLVAEQRYLIWKYCHEQSAAWQTEKRRIQEEADRKRSEAAKKQERVVTESGKTVFGEGQVVGQSVLPPEKAEPGKQAKAASSKANRGAVARGDTLASRRPDLAEKVRKGEVKPAEAHRLMKKEEVAQKVMALPPGKFTVIYADPPWKYSDGRTGDLMTATGALHHYPVMSLAELKAINLSEISALDSVLFLWVPSPLLPEGLELAQAWGFKYKASFVWDKVKHNFGHYHSVRHEFLLLATKGSCLPDNNKLFDSVISLERSPIHSQKPDIFYEIIETIYQQTNRTICPRSSPAGLVYLGERSGNGPGKTDCRDFARF